MPLSVDKTTTALIPYTGNSNTQNRSNRDRVEDAATVTGATGAGVAATRGNALKFFKTSAENLNKVSGTAAQATKAVAEPVKQSRSLINAFRINYKNITEQIAKWAETSGMPNFMKPLFKGALGAAIGKGAAIFVFISGIGEVFHTLLNNVNRAGMKMAQATQSPFETYDKFEYMSPEEYYYRMYYRNR